MKIYKLKNWLIILLISVASSGCTELYDESYNEIIADQFKPTEKDIPALIGSAYTQLRASMLDFDGIWRYQEITADEIVIPARPNGWVSLSSCTRTLLDYYRKLDAWPLDAYLSGNYQL